MERSKHTVSTICRFCRREFSSFGLKKVCPECEINMEKQFQVIKAYINEFPDATAAEICDDLDIPSALLKYYLREERLEIKSNSNNFFLKCRVCNKPISSGRYCFECEIGSARSNMKGSLAEAEIKEDNQITKEIAKFHLRRNTRIGN